MIRILLAMSLIAIAAPAAAQDAAAGEKLFKQRCSVCHQIDKSKPAKLGPLLAGVVGRKSGSVPGARYSAAMKKQSIVWTEQNIDRFLLAPSSIVPGTNMVIKLPAATDRKAVIAYLRTVK
jgi:cytochrome c